MLEFSKGKPKPASEPQEAKLPTPAPIPREFKAGGVFQSGIREKKQFDFREERNQEIEDIIAQLRSAEDDWEERELLVKLSNFLAETEYPDDLVKQSAKASEIMRLVPEKGPVDPIIVNTFIGHAQNYLKVKRLMDQKRDMQEEDWAA